VTNIVDYQRAQSIYFKDPNGLWLEYCRIVGNRGDAMREGAFSVLRAALELGNTIAEVGEAQSIHDNLTR
jgi:hypothetical protein